MTGYEYGSVTPFCLKTQLPIVLSKRINDLNPRFFYMGGGEIDLKISKHNEKYYYLTFFFVKELALMNFYRKLVITSLFWILLMILKVLKIKIHAYLL